MLNEHDPDMEIIEMLAGTKPGGRAEALSKLNGTPEGPAELEAPSKDRPMAVYNADGTNAGVALREAQALAAGFGYKTNEAGEHIGWQKPVLDAPKSDDKSDKPETPDTHREVPVQNKHGGDTGRKTTIPAGKADKKLSPVEDEHGVVIAYRENSLTGRR
jgi:hypothetical protein